MEILCIVYQLFLIQQFIIGRPLHSIQTYYNLIITEKIELMRLIATQNRIESQWYQSYESYFEALLLRKCIAEWWMGLDSMLAHCNLSLLIVPFRYSNTYCSSIQRNAYSSRYREKWIIIIIMNVLPWIRVGVSLIVCKAQSFPVQSPVSLVEFRWVGILSTIII